MFHSMHRSRQELNREQCEVLIRRNSAGVLCLKDTGEYPYGVPLSYVFDEDRDALYFHCAVQGHKLEAIRQDPHSCFTILDSNEVIPETFTTWFRSVILFGTVHIVEDEPEKMHGLELLARRYGHPEDIPSHLEISRKTLNGVCVLRFDIAEMRGKAAKELIQQERPV